MPSFPDFPAERATLARARTTLVARSAGHYVVIVGEEILGTRRTLDDALALGFHEVGGPGFFTARLTAEPELASLPASVFKNA